MIECFNQTIKIAIMQYMTAQGTKRWYDVIDALVDNYNNTYHSTIKAKQRMSSFLMVWALAKLPRT